MKNRQSWRNVGRKIRYLRKAHQLTLRQLALGCGLSPNAISLVERGNVAPTVETLCKIASALGVPASSFLEEICPNEVVLVRACDPRANLPFERALGIFTCAAPPPEPSLLFDSKAHSEETIATYAHQLVLCLNGQIEYETSEKTYLLGPGDSLAFNGNAPHRWRNPGTKPATAVMLVAPGTVFNEEG